MGQHSGRFGCLHCRPGNDSAKKKKRERERKEIGIVVCGSPDYTEHPPLAGVDRRSWRLLCYRFVLSGANLTPRNEKMTARVEAMRHRVRVLRCRTVPVVLNAIQTAGTPIHTIECFTTRELLQHNPFHIGAPLLLPGPSLRTLIVHNSKAVRCFARQFEYLSGLIRLQTSIRAADVDAVMQSLTHLHTLTHLTLSIEWLRANWDPMVIRNGICHARLQVLHIRICGPVSNDAGNAFLRIMGASAPMMPNLQRFYLTLFCGSSSSSLKFEQLLPLMEAPAQRLIAFALDVSGLGSTSLRLSDTFNPVIRSVIRTGRIASVRIGGSMSVPILPLRESAGRPGIQSLTVSARALCDSLYIKTGDDLVLLLPNLRMLQLFVPQTMRSELMHALMAGLLPKLECLTISGCGMFAACGCSHTVALFGAIQCAAEQHPLRPLTHVILRVTVPGHASEDDTHGRVVVFAGMRNMSGRGLRILELRLAGHLGDGGTHELMAALSAASDTLEELCLTGALVLYDLLVPPNGGCQTVFRCVRTLHLVVSIDSLTTLSHPIRCVHLRFPGGLRKMAVHGTPVVNADFTTMCAVTETTLKSAHTMHSMELCNIKWQNANDTVSHFGCQLTSAYHALTSLAVTVHSVQSHHTLEFLCGGFARIESLEKLRLVFVNTTIHRAVADTLEGHRGITRLTVSLLGNTHIPPDAEWPLSALARLPALSHLELYDNGANRPANRSALPVLDATAKARESLHYHREGVGEPSG